MARGVLRLLIGCLAFLAWSTQVSACFFNPVISIGSATQKAKWERERQAAVLADDRARKSQFRRGVRTGRIDSARGLSELLIPNVREWYEDRSDCGPGGDGDGPKMPVEDMFADVFAGSELDGLDGQSLGDLASSAFQQRIFDTHNPDCNAEFRASFADRLNSVLTKRELDYTFLRLSRSGERRSGYFRFADAKRATKPQKRYGPGGAAELNANSRDRLFRALDDFWDEARPRLGTRSLMCPNAYRLLMIDRDQELQRLRGGPRYSLYLKGAAEAREQR